MATTNQSRFVFACRRWLVRQWAVPRFTFFIGKGGVGKTTVSSAYALHCAATAPKTSVLLLSTDPAHSLGDILKMRLGDRAKRLRATGRLWARQIDPDKQIDAFLRDEREDMLALLNKGSLFSRDELEPLLNTSLPGMAEVAALLAVHDLLDSDYDHVVVDTAPMGHAIRLFQMPEHFARFLDVLETAAARDVVLAQHFGGHVHREAALDRWARMVERVQQALSADASRLVLVTTAEPFSLNEASRSEEAFRSEEAQKHIAEIVLNRVVAKETNCSRCGEKKQQSVAARKFLRKRFSGARILEGEDPGCPILGVDALRSFGRHVFEGKKLARSVVVKPARTGKFNLEAGRWPQLTAPLTLTLGKGGVGKTTLSAALAYHHRRTVKAEGVSICSIDPAPSLDDVFAGKVEDRLQPVLRDSKLLAAEFDAMAEFRRWSGQLRARLNDAMTGEERGIHLDLSLDRKFLLALLDLTPPGVDEIFAIFRILDLLGEQNRVVIDMAPTGHALEVLRTPARLLSWARVLLKTLATHRALPMARDAAVEIAQLSQRVRELAAILKDPKRCQVVVVTLPEPLPDDETRRLLSALNELRAPVGHVFVNRVLIDGGGRCARCNLTAQWQAASLARMRRQQGAGEVFVVRDFEAPIAGASGLRQFTQEIWKLG